ncbi:hypothetical protein G6011_04485 [Alternaria panax]|uniref:Uncharacterized protein n=1 Tax=Alternaria panax TaxID=48097 RepID=A0AAD4IH92_9PLEO|nr:hypothetical protein G6011_04485 [Alternaria panax]
MPDHNHYVEPIIAGGRRSQSFLRSPPYPLHDQDPNGQLASTMHGNSSGIIRQPTAEDFLRPDHPLPAPPPKGYDLDQDLPVIKPDSYLPENFHNEHEPQQANSQHQQSSVAGPKRYSTTANPLAHSRLRTRPNYRRSQSELIPSSCVPVLSLDPTMSEHHSTLERVPTIGVDMYQPALGGLQMVSGVQRSSSKRDCVRRWLSDLNPFHKERKFGRQRRD